MSFNLENFQVGDMLELSCDGELISTCLVIEKCPSYEYYGEKPTKKNQQPICTLHIIYKRSTFNPTGHKVGTNWPISQRIMEDMIYTWTKAA